MRFTYWSNSSWTGCDTLNVQLFNKSSYKKRSGPRVDSTDTSVLYRGHKCLKWFSQDVIEVQTLSFNSRGLIKGVLNLHSVAAQWNTRVRRGVDASEGGCKNIMRGQINPLSDPRRPGRPQKTSRVDDVHHIRPCIKVIKVNSRETPTWMEDQDYDSRNRSGIRLNQNGETKEQFMKRHHHHHLPWWRRCDEEHVWLLAGWPPPSPHRPWTVRGTCRGAQSVDPDSELPQTPTLIQHPWPSWGHKLSKHSFWFLICIWCFIFLAPIWCRRKLERHHLWSNAG